MIPHSKSIGDTTVQQKNRLCRTHSRFFDYLFLRVSFPSTIHPIISASATMPRMIYKRIGVSSPIGRMENKGIKCIHNLSVMKKALFCIFGLCCGSLLFEALCLICLLVDTFHAEHNALIEQVQTDTAEH